MGRPTKTANRRGKPAACPQEAFEATLASVETRLGEELSDNQKLIGDDETFRGWCERLAADGLEVDGKPFDLDARPAMAWVYDQVPSTREDCFRKDLVMMKCAQVGFTVMEMLVALYFGLKFGVTVGFFVPNQQGAQRKSANRFMPIVRSIPKVHALMNTETEDGQQRLTEGNAGYRRIGKGQYIFSWTSGQTSTESDPMDISLLDEVQEMTIPQINKVKERMSASLFRFRLLGSTANWPDSDIHRHYLKGTQHVFHTECPECGVRKPLVDYFPRCLKWDGDYPSAVKGRRPGCYRYVCPNEHWIDDPQRGEWIANNPEASNISFHFTQMLSPTISADEIMEKFEDAREDMKGFYNRVLGQPWMDPTETPVTMADLYHCAEQGKALGLKWKSRSDESFMGIDQMGTHSVVVIMERLKDNRSAVIHLQEVYGDDSFEQFSELIERYNVKYCCIEVNPNYLEAKKLATRHLGKVFVADSFGTADAKPIQWKDKSRLDSSDRRTTELDRDRYRVGVHQYKCMSSALGDFKGENPTCLFPDPKELTQMMRIDKRMQMGAVAERAFLHFTKTALVTEQNDKNNQYKSYVKKQGMDPHFSYALMLARIAKSRAYGESIFILPETVTRSAVSQPVDPSGYASQLNPLIEHYISPYPESTCGKCVFAEPGDSGPVPSGWRCTFRSSVIKPEMQACIDGYASKS